MKKEEITSKAKWFYQELTRHPSTDIGMEDALSRFASQILREAKHEELRTAAQNLLASVEKHHPRIAMDTQLDLYMAFHEVKDALKP